MKEIEHKYILKNLPDTAGEGAPGELLEIQHITQFYGKDDWRYRMTRHGVGEGGIEYEKMTKNATDRANGVSEEGEIIPITAATYLDQQLLAYPHLIKKKRYVYRYPDPDVHITIDVFTNIVLIMLEVEIPKINYVYTLPDNIKSQVITEVTGQKAFSNKHLLP